MNRATLTIGGVDYSHKLTYSVKWAQLLDERLDEAEIFLKNVKRADPFTPLDIAEMTIYNAPDTPVFAYKPAKDGVTQSLTNGYLSQTQSLQFVVANDKVENYPVGSEFYTHTLYLVEVTKWLERFIGDSLVFANTKGVDYDDVDAAGSLYNVSNLDPSTASKLTDFTSDFAKTGYYLENGQITIPSFLAIYNNEANSVLSYGTLRESIRDGIAAYNPESATPSLIIEYVDDAGSQRINFDDATTLAITASVNFSLGGGELRYFTGQYMLVYYISIIPNHYPLKMWTVTDAVIRCCELIEPLRAKRNNSVIESVDIPRFRLNGVVYDANGFITNYDQQNKYAPDSQAAKFDKILLPNMTLTKETFREQLKNIGKIIHAEPRAVYRYDNENHVEWYEIFYDEYGGRKYSDLATKKYISQSKSQDIESFCSTIDSAADNFVNTLSENEGALTYPYNNGAITLRTVSVTARIEDGENNESTIIKTPDAIDDLYSVEAAAVRNANGDYNDFSEIRSYICEHNDYLNLSSYKGVYPYVRAYALEYTRGQPNISKLFFKNQNAVSSIFEQYSIKNILEACGQTVYTDGYGYAKIKFRIKYRPIFSQRVQQSKSDLGYKKSVLAYNQSANMVETRFYGENLKGVVARLGTIDETRTYKLAYLSDIPKAGELFDNNYYISAVSVEMTPFYFKVTVALSKDFNRLSQYIGINSINRMYEISEQQVERRDTIYPETLLITDSTETSEEDTLFNDAAMRQLEIMLNGDSTYYSPRQISCAVFYGQTKQGEDIKRYGINLPVISTAFGNAMTFSFSFEDNYSAGQQADKTGNGYFGNYVSYADYFGRIHWANFAFKDVPYIYSGVGNDTEGDYPSSMNDDIPFMLPQQPEKNITKNALITTADAPYLYRKNGEEIPAITYQVNLKTDSGYIIGSGFARNCPLVCGNLPVKNIDGQQRPSHEACKLYIFDKEIDKFTDHFENATNGQAITASLSGATDKKYIDFGILYAQTSGKSWAILTPPNIKKITVEDEDGNISTQQWQNGLAVIIAKNQTITSGEIIKLPRICIKKEIY